MRFRQPSGLLGLDVVLIRHDVLVGGGLAIGQLHLPQQAKDLRALRQGPLGHILPVKLGSLAVVGVLELQIGVHLLGAPDGVLQAAAFILFWIRPV